MYSTKKLRESEKPNEKICAYGPCNEPVTSGRKKYHSHECYKLASNERAREKGSHPGRKTLKSKPGKCLGNDCTKIVDRTDTFFCTSCRQKRDRASGGLTIPLAKDTGGLEEMSED